MGVLLLTTFTNPLGLTCTRELLFSSNINDLSNSSSNHEEGVAIDTGADIEFEDYMIDETLESDNEHHTAPADTTKMAALFILKTTEIQQTSQVSNT